MGWWVRDPRDAVGLLCLKLTAQNLVQRTHNKQSRSPAASPAMASLYSDDDLRKEIAATKERAAYHDEGSRSSDDPHLKKSFLEAFVHLSSRLNRLEEELDRRSSQGENQHPDPTPRCYSPTSISKTSFELNDCPCPYRGPRPPSVRGTSFQCLEEWFCVRVCGVL